MPVGALASGMTPPWPRPPQTPLCVRRGERERHDRTGTCGTHHAKHWNQVTVRPAGRTASSSSRAIAPVGTTSEDAAITQAAPEPAILCGASTAHRSSTKSAESAGAGDPPLPVTHCSLRRAQVDRRYPSAWAGDWLHAGQHMADADRVVLVAVSVSASVAFGADPAGVHSEVHPSVLRRAPRPGRRPRLAPGRRASAAAGRSSGRSPAMTVRLASAARRE